MSGYLLDTNVISLLAPDKPPVSPGFAGWLLEQGSLGTLYLSVVTIAEVERGIKRLERKGADAKAAALASWLAGLIAQFGAHILPVDTDVAMEAGAIDADAEGRGHQPGLADVLIAATASIRDLTVVTLNIRHFAALGIAFSSPNDISAS